jgi:hypothetical protein
MEEWSLTKQTVLYFIIITTAMFPIAYATHWMRHTFVGVLSYIAVFCTTLYYYLGDSNSSVEETD